MTRFTRPVVFLHIPKTAGQTIHNELQRVIGARHVSPVRVHTQAAEGAAQMPAGYRLYSGHIDWDALETLPDPFTFSVLRDPRERIASFYFFLLKEARALTEAELAEPHNIGKRMVLQKSASAYFFGGGPWWREFIHDHYDNFYCSYFATRKMRGWGDLAQMDQAARVQLAHQNLGRLDRVYSTLNLAALEDDLSGLLGRKLNVVHTFANVGSLPQGETRWPRLLALLDSDKDRARLDAFAVADDALIEKTGLTV
ncbi:MAG: sulfotransferase family 2 domain-containing protein [Hyphomonas sp.]